MPDYSSDEERNRSKKQPSSTTRRSASPTGRSGHRKHETRKSRKYSKKSPEPSKSPLTSENSDPRNHRKRSKHSSESDSVSDDERSRGHHSKKRASSPYRRRSSQERHSNRHRSKRKQLLGDEYSDESDEERDRRERRSYTPERSRRKKRSSKHHKRHSKHRRHKKRDYSSYESDDSRNSSRSRSDLDEHNSPRKRERRKFVDNSDSKTRSIQQPAEVLKQVQEQQEQAQRLFMQQMAEQKSAQSQAAVMSLTKKQREIYAGNLTVGLVTAQILRELFNGALGAMDPSCTVINPAVINVAMDASGKFAFVEFRTEDLATLALHLDKVELCGRQVKVGRPRWYIDPVSPQYQALQLAVNQASIAAAAPAHPTMVFAPRCQRTLTLPTGHAVCKRDNVVTHNGCKHPSRSANAGCDFVAKPLCCGSDMSHRKQRTNHDRLIKIISHP